MTDRRQLLRKFATFALGAIAFAATSHLQAQSWPAKPVRIVVPVTAGATDSTARIIADKLAQALGQPFLVDNKPGANGLIGTDIVAKAAPDGYTFLICVDAPITILPSAMTKMPYNVDKDLQPVSVLTTTPTVFIVNSNFQAKTMQEVIAFGKANPDKLNFGSGAIYGQILQEQFKGIGLNSKHIPYKGGAPLQQAIMGGEIETTVMDLGSAVGAGPRVRPLMILSPQRHPQIPNVPTARELGYQKVEGDIWFGMFAPAGTPAAIMQRVNGELARILAMPDVKEKLATIGMQPRHTTPAQLAAIVKEDTAKWGAIIKAAGITME